MIRPEEATRAQYYGRNMPWHMRLSYEIQRIIEKVAYAMQKQRVAIVRHTMKEMWSVGMRVKTQHGGAVVVKNKLILNTDGMGGFIETDVRFDNPPEPSLQRGSTDSYPYIGHYNQIFLEAEQV